MEIRKIKSRAWERLTEARWLKPILVSFFMLLLSLALTFSDYFIEINSEAVSIIIAFVLEICVLMPFSMGYKIYMLSVARGEEEVSVGRIFDGFSFALKLIPAAVIVIAGSKLFSYTIAAYIVNPDNLNTLYVVLALALVFAISSLNSINFYVLYDRRGKPFSSLMESFRLLFVKGAFFKYIALYFSYILWFLAIIISMGMITLIVMPYTETASAVLYDKIRKDELQ